MSFILDALRKSEAERQRETAPSLARAPISTIRREIPGWTWIVIGVLALALAALALAWWQSGPAVDVASSTASTTLQPAANADSGSAPGEPSPLAAQGTEAAAPNPQAQEQTPLPIAELAALEPGLPEFSLEFVAFDRADPANSSAWINGRLYRPGERVAGGPDLVEVVADGVVLAYRGRNYLLELR